MEYEIHDLKVQVSILDTKIWGLELEIKNMKLENRHMLGELLQIKEFLKEKK